MTAVNWSSIRQNKCLVAENKRFVATKFASDTLCVLTASQ